MQVAQARRLRLGGDAEQRKKLEEWIAGALGGSKNVNVKIGKDGQLSASLKKGAEKNLSKEQMAGVKHVQGIINSDVNAGFKILSETDEDGRRMVNGFFFNETLNTQEVDVEDLDQYSQY